MGTNLFNCRLTDIAPVIIAFAEHLKMVGCSVSTHTGGTRVVVINNEIIRSVMRIDAMPYDFAFVS